MGTSSSTRRRILTNYGGPVILLGKITGPGHLFDPFPAPLGLALFPLFFYFLVISHLKIIIKKIKI